MQRAESVVGVVVELVVHNAVHTYKPVECGHHNRLARLLQPIEHTVGWD